MNIEVEVLNVNPSGPLKPGQVISIAAGPFQIKDENSFVFLRGELRGSKGTTSIPQAFFSYPRHFECQIPLDYPETPEQGEQAQLELSYTDNINIYILRTNLTIVNAGTSGKGEMLKCIPSTLPLPEIADTNFTITGTHLTDLSGFYLQKTSGDGPARVVTNVLTHSENIVRIKINPSSILQLKPDSRFKIFAISASSGELVSCPTPIILEDPLLPHGDILKSKNSS